MNALRQPRYRLAAVGFDHMHVISQLQKAVANPRLDVVGAVDGDEQRMRDVCAEVGLAHVPQYVDWEALLEQTRPDIAVVCSATADHAEWVERLAPHGVHVLLEKPFGRSMSDVDRMMSAQSTYGSQVAVNWPRAWDPGHRTTWHRIAGGDIGDVTEVHYYGGNRGPLALHRPGELEDMNAARSETWWYRRREGGGSLLDYVGYGSTLASWYRNGARPNAVTAVWHVPAGLEVDDQSVVIVEYDSGLSTFQTRWGTFTDPWTHQPQPRCGFVVVGTEGTIASWDYAPAIQVQTRSRPATHDVPVMEFPPSQRSALNCLVASLDSGSDLDATMTTGLCRLGQEIIDAAYRSADERVRIPLDEVAS